MGTFATRLNFRNEVSDRSRERGFRRGSIYIRKVHFRDREMITQIESKVVNRLRQVTSAIKQEGANHVSIISSTAERTAAIELAKASTKKPEIVGQAYNKICEDPELAETLFAITDLERMRASDTKVTLIPVGQQLLGQLLVAQGGGVPRQAPVANRS